MIFEKYSTFDPNKSSIILTSSQNKALRSVGSGFVFELFYALYHYYTNQGYNVLYLGLTHNKLQPSTYRKYVDGCLFIKDRMKLRETKNSYQDVMNSLNMKLFDHLDVLSVFEIGSILTTSKKQLRDYSTKFFDTDKGFNYTSTWNNVSRICFLRHIVEHLNVPLNHLIIDPQELMYDFFEYDKYYKFFGHEIKERGIQKTDIYSYQQFIDLKTSLKYKSRKNFDFTFGFSSVTPDREQFFDEILDFVSLIDNTNVFMYSKERKINTFIPKPQYNDLISESKYTLIIKPYDHSTFSIYRFIESIMRNCLPLIHDEGPFHMFNEEQQSFLKVLTVKTKEQLRHIVSNTPEDVRLNLLKEAKKLFLKNNRLGFILG